MAELIVGDTLTGAAQTQETPYSIFYHAKSNIPGQFGVDTEKLSIMTQFLSAEINFYAHANGLLRPNNQNFGEILDANIWLRSSLALVVKQAFESGSATIEDTIIEFFNRNKNFFGL